MVDSLTKADGGVDLLKVHGGTPRASYFAILDQARKYALHVAGHIPDSVLPREAIDSGQRTIEHDAGLAFANSSRGGELRNHMLARTQRYVESSGPGFRLADYHRIRMELEDSAAASYDSSTAAGFAEFAASRPVWFDPTLIVLQTQALKNEPGSRQLPELKYAPPLARSFEAGPAIKVNPTEADLAEGQRRWQAVVRKYRALVRAHAKFVAGTDVPVLPLVPGFSLHRELALLVEIGLSPLQALQAATRNAAEAMGKLDSIGTIETGKAADMVLLDMDPLADVRNLSRVSTVIVRGRLLDRRKLDQMLVEAEAYAQQRR